MFPSPGGDVLCLVGLHIGFGPGLVSVPWRGCVVSAVHRDDTAAANWVSVPWRGCVVSAIPHKKAEEKVRFFVGITR